MQGLVRQIYLVTELVSVCIPERFQSQMQTLPSPFDYVVRAHFGGRLPCSSWYLPDGVVDITSDSYPRILGNTLDDVFMAVPSCNINFFFIEQAINNIQPSMGSRQEKRGAPPERFEVYPGPTVVCKQETHDFKLTPCGD